MIKKGEKKLEFSHLERKWLELTGKENIKIKITRNRFKYKGKRV